MASCVATLASKIVPDCDSPIVGGYTGRGVLIPKSGITSVTQDADNKRIVKAIVGNAYAVDNVQVTSPYDGSNTASSAESGKVQFTKTVSFRIPKRGAGASKDIVEPLVFDPLGFVFVAEKKDTVGDGSFEVIGLQQGLKVTDDGISRNEAENGGDVVVTMSCAENWFECTLFDTDYQTTKAKFETMFAGA